MRLLTALFADIPYTFYLPPRILGTHATCAEEVLRQIDEKGYAADPRRVFRVEVSFSSDTGTGEEWRTE